MCVCVGVPAGVSQIETEQILRVYTCVFLVAPFQLVSVSGIKNSMHFNADAKSIAVARAYVLR